MASGYAKAISPKMSSRIRCMYVDLPSATSHQPLIRIPLSPQYLWLSIPFYNLSLILAKLSVLIFFTRIFRLRKFLICTYSTMAFLIIAGLWMVLSGFLFCIPVHDFWNVNYRLHRAHCLPDGPVWYANAAMQISTDVVILILPMPLLSKLHLPWRQKMGIMLVFGVGVL